MLSGQDAPVVGFCRICAYVCVQKWDVCGPSECKDGGKQFIVSAPVALPWLGLARAVHGTVSILLIFFTYDRRSQLATKVGPEVV